MIEIDWVLATSSSPHVRLNKSYVCDLHFEKK